MRPVLFYLCFIDEVWASYRNKLVQRPSKTWLSQDLDPRSQGHTLNHCSAASIPINHYHGIEYWLKAGLSLRKTYIGKSEAIKQMCFLAEGMLCCLNLVFYREHLVFVFTEFTAT